MSLAVNTCHLGDSLVLSREITPESVDLILVDPPYGLSFNSNHRTRRFGEIANDSAPFIWWILDAYKMLRDGGRVLCFCRWDTKWIFELAFKLAGFNVKSEIIWVKNNWGMGDLRGQVAPQHESIIYATKGRYEFVNGRPKSVILSDRVAGTEMIHPNQKPVELMKQLLCSYSSEDELVVDLFAGVFTVAKACEETNRNHISVEINEEFYSQRICSQ